MHAELKPNSPDVLGLESHGSEDPASFSMLVRAQNQPSQRFLHPLHLALLGAIILMVGCWSREKPEPASSGEHTEARSQKTASDENDQAEFVAVGYSVSTAGDVNGDGFDDLIVGAPLYDDDRRDVGAAYVYLGSTRGPSSTQDWKVVGEHANDELGSSVGGVGDVNGDGFDDIIVSVPGASRVFGYYGSADGLPSSPDWIAKSDQSASGFGRAVNAAGDVNGDGFADVIVGAPDYENEEKDFHGHIDGRAFVYHGSTDGLSTVADWVARGSERHSGFGRIVSGVGDVDYNGFDDIIVVVSGRILTYRGSPAGLSPQPSSASEIQLEEDEIFGISGRGAGDVNGDGFADVIASSATNLFEGRVFVFHGGSDGLEPKPAWVDQSGGRESYFGKYVSGAGDLNGDGYDEVIVGAPAFEPGGRAFIYHGSAKGLSSRTVWYPVEQENTAFGWSVAAAGDTDGDGLDDVIGGAPFFDDARDGAGRAFILLGRANLSAPAKENDSTMLGDVSDEP